MKNLLSTIIIASISFNCFAFWGGKTEITDSVEVEARQGQKYIPGDVVKPVWRESKTNDNLRKYTVKVFIIGLTDRYGNHKKVHLGDVVFDYDKILEIKKHKYIHLFDSLSNPIHRFVMKELKNA